MKNIKWFIVLSSTVIVTSMTVSFSLKNNASTLLMGLDEVEALACGENGCTKNYSKVEVRELDNGRIIITCTGCGSLKCEKP